LLSAYVLVLDLALIVTGITLALVLLLGFDTDQDVKGTHAHALTISTPRRRRNAQRLLEETGSVSGRTTLLTRDGEHVLVDYDALRLDEIIVVSFEPVLALPIEVATQEPDEWLWASDAAAYVGKSVKTIGERWVDEGRLPPPDQPGGPGTARRWKRSDLDRARRGE